MIITILVIDLLLMIITIMVLAQVRHTVRSSRIFDSDPVDIVPSTGMHKSCTASSIADLGDGHDDDDDEDFTQSKKSFGSIARGFCTDGKVFFSKWCGERETERVTSNILQNCHQLGEIQMQSFLGNLNFSGKQSLTAGTTSTIFALPSILSENIYTDLFDHVNKLYCYTVSLSIKLG